MINLLTILAQADPGSPPASPPPSGFGGLFSNPLVPIILVVLVFYFFVFRGQRRDRRRREDMLANVRKNDHVVTVGGLMGTVVAVRDQEITVKIDESSNTKVNLARWAVKTVIPDQG